MTGSMMKSSRRLFARTWQAVAMSAALAVFATGCVASPQGQQSQSATKSDSVQVEVPAGLGHWYSQQVKWRKCGQKQCARVKVPLDWNTAKSDTSADNTVEIAMVRNKAKGKSLGTLFTNPGGPGSSGISFVRDSVADIFDKPVLSKYDVIGWDPRGVGESDGVKCFTNAHQMDDYLYGIPKHAPGTPGHIAEVNDSTKKFGKACERNTGKLLSHVDTDSSVRDMDVLRAVVGSPKLNYVGFSYGTKLGLLYAQKYPKNVGRVVLDGVMDTALGGNGITLGQVRGFDRTIKAYLKHCLSTKRPKCPFSGSVDDAAGQLVNMIKAAQRHPIPNSDGRMLGASTMITAIVSAMYSDQSWDVLTTAFSEIKQGTAATAFFLADFYNDRQDGKYTSNTTEAFTAINCIDYPLEDGKEQIKKYQDELRKSSTILGQFYADGSVSCKGWPVAPTGKPQVVNAKGAAGMLLVGTTGDPATPYEWAKLSAERIPASRLLTVNGNQHTAYSASASWCVRNAVDSYLLKGKLPANGTQCSA